MSPRNHIVLLFWPLVALAQGVEVYLPEVEIKTQKNPKITRTHEFDQVVNQDTLTRYEDVAEALTYETQVMQAKTPMGTDVSMDGLGQDRNLVTVDGVPQIGRVNGALDYDLVPFFMLKKIQVSRRPGRLDFGDQALGGNIMMNTFQWDMPYEHRIKMGVRGTSHNFFHGDFVYGVPTWQRQGLIRAGVDVKKQVQYFLPGYDRTTSDEDDLTSYVAVMQYHHRLNDGHQIAFSFLGGDKHQEGLLNSKIKQHDRWKLQADGAWLAQWSDQLMSEQKLNIGTANFLYQEDKNAAGSFLTREVTEEFQIYNASRWKGMFWDNHQLLFGGDIQFLTLRGDRVRGSQAQHTIAGWYLGSHHNWLDQQWELDPSLRADIDSQGLWTLSPKIQNTLRVHENWDVFFGGGIGYKRPNLRERYLDFRSSTRNYFVSGNPVLNAETAYGLNVGVRYRYRWGVSKVGYDFKSIHDLITTQLVNVDTSGISNFKYVNVSRAAIHQVYTEVHVHPWARLDGYVRYAFLWARNLTANEPLPQSPVHSVLTEVKYDMPSIRSDVVLQLHWLDKAGFFDLNRSGFLESDEIIPSHVMANVFYTYHLNSELDVFARAKNLFDVFDRKFGLSPGFEIMLGIRYDANLGG